MGLGGRCLCGQAAAVPAARPAYRPGFEFIYSSCTASPRLSAAAACTVAATSHHRPDHLGIRTGDCRNPTCRGDDRDLRAAAAGEDALRASGVPYAIVRPTALTEEPAGMPVELDQGDIVKVGLAVGW